MRIGHGYDVHRLIDGNSITIGGVCIPYTKTLLAHSDGDVLLHAICDALLGAAGLGDIGYHFPDTDNKYKNISSIELLKSVNLLLYNKNYSIVNIDCTIIAQAPKMMNYIDQMITNIAHALNLNKDCVNIKATTEEKLGFTGRYEGISAHAVCLISKK